MRGIVYKITGPAAHHVYIGVTSRTLRRRWYEHQWNSAKTNIDTKLYRAMRRHGTDSFSIEMLGVASSLNALLRREVAEIAKHGSFRQGLNSTTGGEKNKLYAPETRALISLHSRARTSSSAARAMLSARSRAYHLQNRGNPSYLRFLSERSAAAAAKRWAASGSHTHQSLAMKAVHARKRQQPGYLSELTRPMQEGAALWWSRPENKRKMGVLARIRSRAYFASEQNRLRHGQRMREIHLAKLRDEPFRAAFSARMREQSQQYWSTPGARDAASQERSQRFGNLEYAEKIREATRKNSIARWSDAEYRKRAVETNRAAAAKLKADPVASERKAQKIREALRRPESVQARSTATRKSWQDPQYRDKVTKAIRTVHAKPVVIRGYYYASAVAAAEALKLDNSTIGKYIRAGKPEFRFATAAERDAGAVLPAT